MSLLCLKPLMSNNYVCEYVSPIGLLHLVSDGEALTELWIEGQRYAEKSGIKGEKRDNLSIFNTTRQWLDVYFSGRNPGNSPAVNLIGSPFQLSVWCILQQIPYGETITYADIARQIAIQRGVLTMSAQAVGGAVGHNPVGIIVPCHRVIGTNGSLTGYAGGIDKKLALLRLEHAAVANTFLPYTEEELFKGEKGKR